jgi:hypothetical protein
MDDMKPMKGRPMDALLLSNWSYVHSICFLPHPKDVGYPITINNYVTSSQEPFDNVRIDSQDDQQNPNANNADTWHHEHGLRRYAPNLLVRVQDLAALAQ